MAKIMITDDTDFMRMQIKNMLTELGHEVVGEAKNGKEAIRMYNELQPDLTTMDINMPEMDGIEAVKAIIDKHPQAKIIMCSAMSQQAVVIDAMKYGAKDFIVKPLTKERLREAVDGVLGEGE